MALVVAVAEEVGMAETDAATGVVAAIVGAATTAAGVAVLVVPKRLRVVWT